LGGSKGGIGVKNTNIVLILTKIVMVLMEIIDTLRGMTGISYDKEREREFDDDDLDEFDEEIEDD
jgi:hypothetical protein